MNQSGSPKAAPRILQAVARAIGATLATTLFAVQLSGCSGGTPTGARGGGTTQPLSSSQRTAVVARCEGEGVEPRRGWHAGATASGPFGLMVRHMADQERRLRNGNALVKAGAVVVGDEAITLLVPAVEREQTGLIYGDEMRGRRRVVSEAAQSVRFVPCRGQARSGYVGGLIIADRLRTLRLAVRAGDLTTSLTLRP